MPIITSVTANHGHKVQQWHSSTRLKQKNTMMPLAAPIQAIYDLWAQLTASWNQLYGGFWGGGKTGEPGEKSKSLEEEKRTNTNSSNLLHGIRISSLGQTLWEASALTTTPSLLTRDAINEQLYMLGQPSIKDYFKSNNNFWCLFFVIVCNDILALMSQNIFSVCKCISKHSVVYH